ncbi:ATP-binding protein [Roseateles flavus]|uniref:histidine kinase n=1 Tax=Roseateles flavus TaxID=3149041 RepID=A0ABV0G8W4_9BURK
MDAAAVGEIRVAYDAGFAPISYAAEDGEAKGLAVEIFRRTAEAAKIKYRLTAFPSFGTALAALKSGQADVVLAAVRSPERLEFATFVGPYYTSPSALVSRLDGGGWPSLDTLANGSLAIDQDHYLIPVIQREHPRLLLRVVPSVEQVLVAVADGRAEAGLANVEFAAAQIATRYAGRLQVSGTVDRHPSDLSFMVRADRPDVEAALRMGLTAVPERERHMLANALLRTKIPTGLQWRDVALTVAPFFAGLLGLLLATLLYARRLKLAREELRLQRDLARNEAQAKAAFLADVGHDVRTPLAALAKGLQLLQREPLGDKGRDMVGVLRGSAERLVELLNGLLDIARLEMGRLELMRRPGDLLQLVNEAVEQFRPMATARNLDLRVELPKHLPLLMLDSARTAQVVNNLLSNALKFTEQGFVRVTMTAKPVSVRLWKITLVVADTGVGMDETTRVRLFERFRQGPDAQRLHGGHGLGMSIVSQILQLAQGRVDVRSTPGQGTEVEVAVLMEEANQTEPLSRAQAARSVLLVDDDAVAQIVLGEQLRSKGFEVSVAATAEEALQRLHEGGIDVLISDANLGVDSSGLALAAQAKGGANGAGLRVLILSGDAGPQSLPPSIDGWVQKPVSPADESWMQEVSRLLNVGNPQAASSS